METKHEVIKRQMELHKTFFVFKKVSDTRTWRKLKTEDM